MKLSTVMLCLFVLGGCSKPLPPAKPEPAPVVGVGGPVHGGPISISGTMDVSDGPLGAGGGPGSVKGLNVTKNKPAPLVETGDGLNAEFDRLMKSFSSMNDEWEKVCIAAADQDQIGVDLCHRVYARYSEVFEKGHHDAN